MTNQAYWEYRYLNLNENLDPMSEKSGVRFKLMNDFLTKYSPSTVLDIGTGWGRFFKLYAIHQDKCFIAADVAEYALFLAAKFKPNNVVLWQADVTKRLPWNDNIYDTTIAVEVLQHIPTTNIKWSIKEMCRVSEKRVMVLDFYAPPEEQHILAKHCFQHDLLTLFKNEDMKLVEQIHVDDKRAGREFQEMFVWEKNEDSSHI